MATGKHSPGKFSPIVRAISLAEAGTTGEIRVHISRKWLERNPYLHAKRLFHRFGMTKTTYHNAVLLYVNLKKRKFAIIGDSGIHQVVGQKYWEELVETLRQDLRSTHPDRAIALAVENIGNILRKYFPIEPGLDPANELADEVSED